MSLPDLIKDVSTAENKADAATNKKSPVTPLLGEACKPKKLPLRETRSAGGATVTIDFDWESDSMSSLDEGEATWDALGRMNSIRRSNRFDKPQLLTVELKRSTDGFGLELEGRSPAIVHAVCKCQTVN